MCGCLHRLLGVIYSDTQLSEIQAKPCLDWFVARDNVPHTTANRYKTVIPSKRHRPVGKETGQTNPIERLNNTFRQRISRLVRESLSFSKKMENHVGEPFGILSMTTMHSKAKD